MPRGKSKPKKKSTKRPKLVVDRRGLKLIRRVDKALRQYRKYVGLRSQDMRAVHARQAAGVIDEMLRDEKRGWLD